MEEQDPLLDYQNPPQPPLPDGLKTNCVVCNEPTVSNGIGRRYTLNISIRASHGIKTTHIHTVKYALETLIARLYNYENVSESIRNDCSGRYICRECTNRISTLYCVYENFNAKVNSNGNGSYINLKMVEAEDLRLKKDEDEVQNASKTPPQPQLPPPLPPPTVSIKEMLKTKKGRITFTTFVHRQIRQEYNGLMKNSEKLFTAFGPDEIQNVTTFWDDIHASLETHAPLILRILEGIGDKSFNKKANHKYPLKPAIGAALCILINSRNQKCSRFQKICSFMLAGTNSKKVHNFFNALKICFSYKQRTRMIKDLHEHANSINIPAPNMLKEFENNIQTHVAQERLPIPIKRSASSVKPVHKKPKYKEVEGLSQSQTPINIKGSTSSDKPVQKKPKNKQVEGLSQTPMETDSTDPTECVLLLDEPKIEVPETTLEFDPGPGHIPSNGTNDHHLHHNLLHNSSPSQTNYVVLDNANIDIDDFYFEGDDGD